MENPSASKDNPRRTGYFVRTVTRTGILNPGTFVELTDKKGDFWMVPKHIVKPAPPKAAE